MNRTNIYQIDIIKQQAKVGILTKRKYSLDSLIENLIREHGHSDRYTMRLDVNTLPISDKRLLISHFEAAEWYAYACESIVKTEAMFEEIASHVQKLVDDAGGEVYRDAMEEMRAYK